VKKITTQISNQSISLIVSPPDLCLAIRLCRSHNLDQCECLRDLFPRIIITLTAICFRWTVRRQDNGEYYVDETIGENSAPVTSGPMSDNAALRFADECESEARQRFEQIKSEMAGRSAASAIRNHSDEL
jgi:hypothetical protein